MNLHEAKSWALEQGIDQSTLRHFCDECLLVAISRLLQAIHREHYTSPSLLEQSPNGVWWLNIGQDPVLKTPLTGPLPFQRLEASGFPCIVLGGRTQQLNTSHEFLRGLRLCLGSTEAGIPFDRLNADFDNSFANLVLNRVLFHLQGSGSSAIEPAYEAHHYYPFPALRFGPSLQQIVSCSNLSRQPVQLPLLSAGPCRFVSTQYDDYGLCVREWAGIAVDSGPSALVPVHPWQLQLSPVLRSLQQVGMLKTAELGIAAVPLASQRTCRIVATGFDVKLPIDVTLTGEHRLLYPMNVMNAPVVSALARALLGWADSETIEFQYDMASIVHPDPHIGCHFAAIIRSPIPDRMGESIVPALNLWSGPKLARTLLRVETPECAYEVFVSYCRVLMEGSIEFYARWGMAFEPHLQNVLVRIQNGVPVGIIVRDLDGTILDPTRIPIRLREHGLRLPMEPWDAMPLFTIGCRRLVHALFYGHLGHVMSYLAAQTGLELTTLSKCVEEVWAKLTSATSRWPGEFVRELRDRTRTVKCILAMRLARSMEMMFLDVKTGVSSCCWGDNMN